jgi:hypothetical protein
MRLSSRAAEPYHFDSAPAPIRTIGSGCDQGIGAERKSERSEVFLAGAEREALERWSGAVVFGELQLTL